MSKLEQELADAPSFTAAPSKEQSLKLKKLGQELYGVISTIEDLESRLEEAKAAKKKLTEETLPEYMNSIGQDRIGLPDENVDLVLEPYYHANIKAEWPDEQREAAFRWLEENGHGDLVKTEFSIMFPKRQLPAARWLQALIKTVTQYYVSAGGEVFDIPEPIISLTVPWNTLTAFVREQTEKEQGDELPLELLGATIGSVVKLKERKGKKR